MGNAGYDHHPHHHHRHPFYQKNIFLPIFCRLSINDIKLNNHCKDRISGDEPSSPKVSCIGQVKRNNRVIGFPTAAAATTIATAGPVTVSGHHRYTKLKKLFSRKTLLPPTTTTRAGAGGRNHGSRSCRVGREMRESSSARRKKLKKDGDQDCVKAVVDIGEMDPPLPVVKKVAPPGVGRDEVNIWERRFNGVGLKRLQIEQIHLRNDINHPPTTV